MAKNDAVALSAPGKPGLTRTWMALLFIVSGVAGFLAFSGRPGHNLPQKIRQFWGKQMATIEIEFPRTSGSTFTLDVSAATCYKTERRLVQVTVSRNFKGMATVNLVVTGGKAQSEDYGFGRDFTGSGTWINQGYQRNCLPLVFAATELKKTIRLQLEDNLVVEPDKILTLSLEDQQGKTIGRPKTITLIDDRLAGGTFVDVTKPPAGLQPMTGQGDESSKLNAIINYINTRGNGKGIVYFPEGTFSFKLVNLKPHITVLGAGIDRTFIKLVDPPLVSSSFTLSRSTMCRVTTSSPHGLGENDIVCFLDIAQQEWKTVENVSYGLLILDSTSFYIFKYFTIGGWKYKVRQLVRGTNTTVKMSYLSSDTYVMPAVGDYIFFRGLPAPWDVLNNNHYQVTSVNTSDKTFTIAYDSSGLPSDNSYNSADIWCAATFDSSAMPEYNGSGNLFKQDEWARTFRVSADANWTNTPIAFKNITFDGNRSRQGPADFYQIEHQGSIFLTSDAANNTIHCKLERLKFVNSSGDGVYCYHDAMARGYKLEFANIRRGSVVFNGYRHNDVFYDLTIHCPETYNRGRIDMEAVLSGSTSLEKINSQGWIQVGTGSEANLQNISNFNLINIYLSVIYGIANLTNGTIYCTDNSSRIRDIYGTVNVNNVSFTIGRLTGGTPGGVYLERSRPGSVNITNCRVTLDTNNPPDLPRYCFYTGYFDQANAGVYTFSNCQWGRGFDCGLYITRGGVFNLFNIVSKATKMVSLYGYITNYYFPVSVTLKNCDPGDGYYMEIRLVDYYHITINHPIENGAYTTILTYPKSQYIVVNDHKINTGTFVFTGGRYILGIGAPSAAVNGMPGDVYENTLTGQKWTITNIANAGWTRPDGSIKSAVWSPI